ncbi:MAG: long-chain fatty acid--CoA ligase [Bacteroidales bacterium]|nr:long-chain fatty acid--CoA ligase [Bacteroidales bacterium]
MLNLCHLSRLIPQQAERYGQRTALSWRDYDSHTWQPVSWVQFAAHVDHVAQALVANGVDVQENIAVFSQNKPECFYVNFGAYSVRAVPIPFYATSSGAQVTYMVNDAAVRLVFVGEQEQYDTMMSVLPLCHSVERIVIFDRAVKRRENDRLSVYFDEWETAEAPAGAAAEVEQRRAAATLDDVADILYTSGTTGVSKGVILTHGMYHAGIRANDAVLNLSEDDVILNFLPLTHVFERAWSYLCLCEGARLAVNLRPTDVQRSLQEVHPTCMCSVPRFWEKVYQGVMAKLDESGLLQRKLISGALKTGARCWTDYLSQNKPLPPALSMKYGFYQRTIIRLLRRTLGLEKANFFPTAGAAVSPEVERFVHAAGINMVVGYGLTESTATVSCDRSGMVNSAGSVGRLIDGLEIKFGPDDEILLRGKTITPGYYRKPQATSEAIDADGWFHTGDAGYMKDGELFLTERIKDLFKTSNGKYIAPQMLETQLAQDKYIEQVAIIGDCRKYVTAIIIPAFKALREYARQKKIAFVTNADLIRNIDIRRLIQEHIDKIQQNLASYEKVKRFILLPHEFTVESGELTNTLKLRRPVINRRYASEIESMYS